MNLHLRYTLQGSGYNEVPQVVAEADTTNGRWAVFNGDIQVGLWHVFDEHSHYPNVAEEARKSVPASFPDIIGSELSLGDIVAFSATIQKIHVGRILRFTPKMVAVHDLRNGHVEMKTRTSITKIHDSLW